jgi:hypothetical protein
MTNKEIAARLDALEALVLDKGALREAQLKSKEDRKLAERQRVRALVSDHASFDPNCVDGREAINLASRGEVIELLRTRPELTDSVINTRRHDKSLILAAIAPAPAMVRVSTPGNAIECKEQYSTRGNVTKVTRPYLKVESLPCCVSLSDWESAKKDDPRLRDERIKVEAVSEVEARKIAARSSYYNPPSVSRVGY